MPNYSYYYVKAIAADDGTVKTHKFFKGDPKLLGDQKDVWGTHGRYNLITRHLRGGLSGSGDVHHPANALFKNTEGYLISRFTGNPVIGSNSYYLLLAIETAVHCERN